MLLWLFPLFIVKDNIETSCLVATAWPNHAVFT